MNDCHPGRQAAVDAAAVVFTGPGKSRRDKPGVGGVSESLFAKRPDDTSGPSPSPSTVGRTRGGIEFADEQCRQR